jgi:WD40 repeat protein
LLSYTVLPEKSRAIDVEPRYARDIAVALNSGKVLIVKTEALLNPNQKYTNFVIDSDLNGVEVTLNYLSTNGNKFALHSLDEHDETASAKSDSRLKVASSSRDVFILYDSKQWIEIVKYSFDGQFLAVGSHDECIYLYDVNQSYRCLHTCQGHSSYITHIDFGINLNCGEKTIEIFDEKSNSILEIDRSTHSEKSSRSFDPNRDLIMQSTDGNYGLRYWKIDGTEINSASLVKDAWWATWTSPYGFPVQGIAYFCP